ncbi:protein translocase subunit SecF [Proteocatella sphenisci]|uniref:protein translocase subunit SecF n=1 Tax=Proteocatella sphenisci TaxID=181070 RepID=UPI0004B636DE|nr:protein translocase subunit SecF [Proteocatella sphenisci]
MKLKKDLKVIANYKKYFTVSLVIILIGMALAGIRGFNYGIDFTGGTLIEINMRQYVTTEEIKEITDKFDPGMQINYIGEEKDGVQLKTTIDLNNKNRSELFGEFASKYDLSQKDLVKSEQFGPSIGKEIKTKAIVSVLIATIAMLVYISFRFKLNFGIAAIAALIHDVLFVLALYSIFQIPLNSPFVAAMLTVVGYSINDTIVVFDRIRENMIGAKRDSFGEVADLSINQTISRSVNTSLTTLLAIIALYVMGVESIKEFTLPLIAGISVGVYSSIFIASPIWVLINRASRKNQIKNLGSASYK